MMFVVRESVLFLLFIIFFHRYFLFFHCWYLFCSSSFSSISWKTSLFSFFKIVGTYLQNIWDVFLLKYPISFFFFFVRNGYTIFILLFIIFFHLSTSFIIFSFSKIVGACLQNISMMFVVRESVLFLPSLGKTHCFLFPKLLEFIYEIFEVCFY